ncbi:expressed unknown protein [Seminavis robusta]|uniref:Uncharacterized protein n=1 Tax=Seminavis robusta TaxID=568900 RepID=A0A9N8EJX8_9STRA|nr:expressed unknown protein [Seminavis robusta]|eukprot:Sro1371_g267110.1 n/a (332) ;mRNA; f:23025-24020
MAPNQKFQANSLHTAHDNEPSLLLAQPQQYLPLTNQQVQDETVIQHDATAIKDLSVNKPISSGVAVEQNNDRRKQDENEKYWNWPTLPRDTAVVKCSSFKIKGGKQHSQAHDFLFSADFIEAKLVAESQRIQERLQQGVTIIRAPPREDGYWEERSGKDVVLSNANQAVSERTGYWDWSPSVETDRAPLIALIRQEEFARQQVSAKTMEHLEQLPPSTEHAATKCRRTISNNNKDDAYWHWESPPTTIHADPSTVHDSYWEWNTERTTTAEAAALLASILEHEATRQLFSIEHVTDTLVAGVQQEEHDSAGSKRNMTQESEDYTYWTWVSS